MENTIKNFILKNTELMLDTLKELCHIPAPSHYEEKRAEYCKNWLEKYGAMNVYIDSAKNVIFPINCENSDKITVFVAHTDTVFPDTEPMPYYDDGEKIHCPGCGDDTASLAVLLTMAKYYIENDVKPNHGIMFVCNSCEEGLGNLKGTRQIFSDFEGRIERFVSFDSNLGSVVPKCVGSHRYEVEVLTEGGHSFGAFGNANAIEKLSNIVTEIYKINVPVSGDSKTTYNVGNISGGTSVNTIAQSAKMLCEYRSDSFECMEIMQKKFEEIFENAKSEKVTVNVTKIGDRPCGNISDEKVQQMIDICKPIMEEVTGKEARIGKGSTDCNIPLSLGVSAVCIGVNIHKGTHTREEWVEKATLIPGLEIAIKTGLKMTDF